MGEFIKDFRAAVKEISADNDPCIAHHGLCITGDIARIGIADQLGFFAPQAFAASMAITTGMTPHMDMRLSWTVRYRAWGSSCSTRAKPIGLFAGWSVSVRNGSYRWRQR